MKESGVSLNTPTSDRSISTNRPSPLTQNVDNVFASLGASQTHHPPHVPMNEPKVLLCNKFGKNLAKGHVVTDPSRQTCHFKRPKNGEKIVCVEEVFDPDDHF